eukprot:TRINITY_DN36996_c0_g2_i1.p1 TRINITY_DN36996_c0_g2~~TRINITY_DN36996_c0_g2_i1.p1  ORF type:complete len:150 (+),score=9.41 TRINITY_DN36996_c0_g2_i1:480-929(+)
MLADKIPFATFEMSPVALTVDITIVLASAFLFTPLAFALTFMLSAKLSRIERHAWLLDLLAATCCSTLLFVTWYGQAYAIFRGSWQVVLGVVLFEALAVTIVYWKPWDAAETATASSQNTPEDAESSVPEHVYGRSQGDLLSKPKIMSL